MENKEKEKENVSIDCLLDGPIVIEGDFTMKDADGNEIETKRKVFLCRCGASANKPFCDGKHKKLEFKAN